MSSETTNFQIYTAIQSLEDLKRVYNEQSEEESVQGEDLIEDTRHSYHETHPTLIKIKFPNYLFEFYSLNITIQDFILSELASEQPWTHEIITDIAIQYFQHLYKDYLALKKNPNAFDNRNIKQRRDNCLSIKSKALLKALDQYSDVEDLHYPKEEIKLILHKHSGIPCPSTWSPYSKEKEKDNGMFKRVYSESEHSQYEKLIGLLPDKLSFLPDWAYEVLI
ncbi:17784_t:CDS:2 [Cetraspora pellucida]|uniref:17784_t:CDS:1 n=1 Tax=Cetraspora pellucida TaxID=1433469 RepID=A0A9N9ABV6_9GLOM|nr:17784_t:CDS:2 [Cetraspora pellucida]